jgi:predicted GIY-YIG superfamily endonuclease
MHPTYKRMLAGLKKEKASKSLKKSEDPWSLYILKCRDGSFYTGITNNLARRFKMHQDGKASRYTRTRGPVEMLYSETCGDRSSALVRECEVKEWPKKKKEALVSGEIKIKAVKNVRRKKKSARAAGVIS